MPQSPTVFDGAAHPQRHVGHGDPWEQHHVETVSLDALRDAVGHGLADESLPRLRETLIQRGRHDAARIH